MQIMSIATDPTYRPRRVAVCRNEYRGTPPPDSEVAESPPEQRNR
jgi:hypothetical protein